MGRLLFVLVTVALTLGQTGPSGVLDIYFIDTEGGQATLYRAPSGETLLVDTGNAGERDLQRILQVFDVAEVKQIDHLLLTHYHSDHYGGLSDLSKRIPIKHFYDHGESVELDRPNIAAFMTTYRDIVGRGIRTVVKPGDRIPFDGASVTIVVSDGQVLRKPLENAPGAGRSNAACAGSHERDESKVDPDNHQSAGFVLAYGRFRTINLGDFTWNRELQLMCPTNPIGTVDLYLTSHHGLDQSGSPALVHGLQPRVAIMNNGTRKGGHVQTAETLESSFRLEDVWQLHWSYWDGVEHNAPGLRIANVDEPAQLAAIVAGSEPPAGANGNAAHAPAYYIKVSARTDGSFTVTNSRNKYSKTYRGRT
jgi:competence protein ComEC